MDFFMESLILVFAVLWLAFHIIRLFWKWIVGGVISSMIFDLMSKHDPALAHQTTQTLDTVLRSLSEYIKHIN
jgi:hypothetical protein